MSPPFAKEAYPALAEARRRSLRLLAAMGGLLRGLPLRTADVLCVSVSGSLGRLEAGPHSDADLIVLVADGAARAGAMNAVWETLSPLNLPRPKAAGIFATATTRAELLDPATLGRVVEDVGVFGKRMQLLLDAQPVYGADAHRDVVRAILERYATGFGTWDTLLNDLVRYYRSLCLEAQWDFGARGGGWYVRDLKRRHSRATLYAALLFLLGESNKEKDDKITWLAGRLGRTPLDRIAEVYAANDDPHFGRVAAAYDCFLAGMNDATVRAELAGAAPAKPEDLTCPAPASYAALDANARALAGEFLRFVLARRDDWGERFFTHLLF